MTGYGLRRVCCPGALLTRLKCIGGRHGGELLAVVRRLRNPLLPVVQVVDGEDDLGLPQTVRVVVLPVGLRYAW